MLIEYAEIPTKDTRYAYTTGRIRALELYLFKEADFLRMKQADRVEETLQFLSKTFPYSESMKDIGGKEGFEQGLDVELKRTRQELNYFCPEPELVDLFWLEDNFHNLKVLLKNHFLKKFHPEDSLFLRPVLSQAGTFDLTLLEESIEKEDFTQLTPELRTLLEEVFSLMENNQSPHFLDSFLDTQFFQWGVSRVRVYSDPFLTRLVQLQIDSFNIKTFFRIKFGEEEKGLQKGVFMKGGTIDGERLFQIASQPLRTLSEELKNTDYGEAIKEALEEKEKKKSLFSLDRFFDKYILEHTYCGFYITLGREPLVNYIFLKKQEIKWLRIILRAKLAGIDFEELWKQLE